jgi:hypothetical protein
MSVNADENLYCKIFIDGAIARKDLIALLAASLSGVVSGHTVVMQHLELDVLDNDDFIDRHKRRDPDDFIHFRYFLDVEPAAGAARNDYVARVGEVQRMLAGNGLRTVAACSFEDELPLGGRVP